MENYKSGKLCIFFVVLVFLQLSANAVFSQEIMLDKMEKCGDLICYPEMKDPNNYYYLPDQPRIASKDGKPQFSFLKYARTEATGKAGTGQAQGGGVIHFLVTYGVSETRIREAERDLQQKHPDANIAGPIVYRKGNFALITSFMEGSEMTTKTVAVGKAPLMEGSKTAVSMALTREGAELLWASFQTDTPDISLVFDMEFAGIREPYEATLEADWSSIAKHDRIQAGFKYKWFGADIDMMFQELRQTGAIKITTKGENAVMDRILESANEKLLKVMFDPVTSDDLTRAAAEGGYESLNQAAKMLKDAATSTGSTGKTGAAAKTSGLFHEIDNFIRNPFNRVLMSRFFNSIVPDVYAQTSSQETKIEKNMNTSGPSEADPNLGKSREAFSNGQGHYANKEWGEAFDAFTEGLNYYSYSKNPDPKERAVFLFHIGVSLMGLERFEEALSPLNEAADLYGRETQYGKDAEAIIKKIEKLLADKGAVQSNPKGEEQSAISANDSYNEARRLYEEARNSGFPQEAVRKVIEAYEKYRSEHNPTGDRASEVEGRIRMLKERLKANDGIKSTSDMNQDLVDASKNGIDGLNAKGADKTPSDQTKKGTTAENSSTGSELKAPDLKSLPPLPMPSTANQPKTGTGAASTAAKPQTTAQKSRSDGSPGFSLVASYKMKKIKRSGKMVYNMNSFRTETQAFAMAENIGDIYKLYGNDPKVFRAITIDDPVFKQREIMVTLDGQDASTFTRYLNFVTVKMKKRHQGGEMTTGETVITPEIFNTSGNNFSMVYGWKDDSDRTAWLNYEYQAIWSFYGGVEIRTPWTGTDSPMLALIPPHHYRTVSIEGDGDTLTGKEVRHGVVTFTCRLGEKYISQQVTIRNSGPAPSMVLDIPEDTNNPETMVDITWYLTGSRKLASEKSALEGDILYWDELPKGGI
ncbi:MAG: hypothetical protein JXL81_09040 [Deltaproteobacteria bacterium]|nr:hypothetical protein [Deltaproteobacteria bacterium]